MNAELKELISRAVQDLIHNPESLGELLEECLTNEIIGLNEEYGFAYWYHTGESLQDK
jgi:hypothetical protein